VYYITKLYTDSMSNIYFNRDKEELKKGFDNIIDFFALNVTFFLNM